jgi:RNA polymerase sigma factor (sigma-70 family)
MDQRSDMQLLRDWVDRRDREAIGELIRRHIDFVLNIARRQVGNDSHLAEDITQAVFILLLQKAHRIKSEAAMAGWFFTTTRFAASNARRMIRRREYYERQAAAQAIQVTALDQTSDLEPLLNEAIARLSRNDRECVVMSYLQQKTNQQLAQSLGISEDAARVRVSRAVRRMRDFFISRGITTAGEATMGALLVAGKASKASTILIESTLNIATLSQPAGASTSAMTIAKGVTQMIYAMKVKVAAAIAVVLFSGLVTAQVVQRALSREAAVIVMGQVQNAGPQDSSSVSLGDGVSVTFMGVSKYPETPQSWYSIDGKSIARPLPAKMNIAQFDGPAAQVLVRVHGPEDAAVKISATTKNPTQSSAFKLAGSDDQWLLVSFALTPDQQSPAIRIDIADGPWGTLTRLTRQPWEKEPWAHIHEVESASGEDLMVSPAVERDGNAAFYVATSSVIDGQLRMMANDVTGLQHIGAPKDGAGSDKIKMTTWAFDIPAMLIGSIEFQTRPYNKHVTAKNLSFDAAKPANPQINVDKSP